jgi:hypothetical protein
VQTKRQSLVESLVHTGVGILTRYATVVIVFPVLGIVSSAANNFAIAIALTAVSLVRTYIIRRIFVWVNK